MSRQLPHAGFTLIEVLVYIGVLLLSAIAVVTMFFSLRDVFERNRTERELADAATEILERFGREARYATEIEGTSVLGSSPGLLDLDQISTSTRFSLSGDDLIMEQNGSVVGALHPESISVTSLVFTKFESVSTSTAVRAAVTLSATNRFASTTKTFYTTALLRGSYDP